MSNTIIITDLDTVTINGGPSIALALAVSSGACTADEAFAALGPWNARALTTATSNGVASQNKTISDLQQKLTDVNSSITNLQNQIDTLGLQYHTATTPKAKLVVADQAFGLTTPAIKANLATQIAQQQAQIAQLQAQHDALPS